MKKLAVLAGAIAVTSCASMFNGTEKAVTIKANDKDAKIYVNEQYVGTGNAHYVFKKKKDYHLRAELGDCRSPTIIPTKSFDPTTLLGILLDYGIISILLIDGAASGAWTDFDQAQFSLEVDCNNETT